MPRQPVANHRTNHHHHQLSSARVRDPLSRVEGGGVLLVGLREGGMRPVTIIRIIIVIIYKKIKQWDFIRSHFTSGCSRMSVLQMFWVLEAVPATTASVAI